MGPLVSIERQKLGFLWSYKPIFIWIRLMLGVDLNVSVVSSAARQTGCLSQWLKRMSWLFSCVMLSFVISISCLYTIFVFKTVTWTSVRQDGYNLTKTNLVLIYVTTLSNSIETPAIYFIFFLSVLNGKWQSFWLTLEEIQRQTPKLEGAFYRRCRTFAVVGVLFILTRLGVNTKLAIESIWPGKFLASFFGCLTKVADFATVSVLTLYCVIVFSVAHMFRHLNSTMSAPRLFSESSSDWLSNYLEDWRRLHVLVCQLVDEIKSLFGIILLITLTHGFINLISDTFEFISACKNGFVSVEFVFISRLLLNLIRLSFVCFGSYFVESEASRTLRLVRQLGATTVPLTLRLQLDRLVLGVSKHSCKITAANFFDVNLSFFPTLVGSTLTYLIIVWEQG